MKLTTFLFRAARLSADADAIMNPHKLPRRIKNKLVGRLLGRAGFLAGIVEMTRRGSRWLTWRT